jgi:hypothetical protein
VLNDFTDAVYTHKVGIYTLNVAIDGVTATAVPVAASMHVTILGGAESQPGWRYAGTGAAFSVTAAGFLTLDRLALHNPVTVDGGSLTLLNLAMHGTTLAVTSGALAITSCELVDTPLTLDDGGSATITGTTFRSTAAGDFAVLSAAAGASFTVSGSELVGAPSSGQQASQGDPTCFNKKVTMESCCDPSMGDTGDSSCWDETYTFARCCPQRGVSGGGTGRTSPLPCDGTLPVCDGPHTGAVTVEGPADVSFGGPLVCGAEGCSAMPTQLVAAGVTADQLGVGLAAGAPPPPSPSPLGLGLALACPPAHVPPPPLPATSQLHATHTGSYSCVTPCCIF